METLLDIATEVHLHRGDISLPFLSLQGFLSHAKIVSLLLILPNQKSALLGEICREEACQMEADIGVSSVHAHT